MSSLQGKVVLLVTTTHLLLACHLLTKHQTGASIGIGEAIATSLVESGANLILCSRSEDKLVQLKERLQGAAQGVKITHRAVDVGNYTDVEDAVSSSIKEMGHIDILINNAGLALGAPSTFPQLKIPDIMTMNNTNINGYMFMAHAVLNHSMIPQNSGTILNITSITGLEAPPFPGEAVYHANKACQEAFTNALRNELSGTDIRVLALRPGCVATHFHSLRVGYDKGMYDEFFEGYEYVSFSFLLGLSMYGAFANCPFQRPLIAPDVAQAAVYMLQQPLNISVKALDVVPSAQRSLTVIDRKWNERQHQT